MSVKKRGAAGFTAGTAMHPDRGGRMPAARARDKAPTRQDVVDALLNLDDEGFNYIASMVWQQSMHAGGFVDKAGWAHLRDVLEWYLNAKQERAAR